MAKKIGVLKNNWATLTQQNTKNYPTNIRGPLQKTTHTTTTTLLSRAPDWKWHYFLWHSLPGKKKTKCKGPGTIEYTLPETNSEFTPENGWLEDDPASFWGKKAQFHWLLLLVSGSVHSGKVRWLENPPRRFCIYPRKMEKIRYVKVTGV